MEEENFNWLETFRETHYDLVGVNDFKILNSNNIDTNELKTNPSKTNSQCKP